MKHSQILIPCLVLLAACWRSISLSSSGEPFVRLPTELISSVSAGERLSPESIDRLRIDDIRYQRFDSDAVVAVQAGADQMPGVAGTDDNLNGVVDDRLELGATRSDDPCVVMTADRLAQIPADNVLVLQRGAFVETHGPVSNDRCRARVIGKFDNGDRWSALIDID